MNSSNTHAFTLWTRKFLYGSGRKQSELATELNLSNARLSELINNKKNDLRSKTSREHILKMILVFHKWGELTTLEQANNGLDCAGQPQLGHEKSEIENRLIQLLNADQKERGSKVLQFGWRAGIALLAVIALGLATLYFRTRGIGSVEINPIHCPEESQMVFISEGSFEFGSTNGEIEEFALLCPDDDSSCSSAYFTDELVNQNNVQSDKNRQKRSVFLSGYCIDQFEVTVSAFEGFANSTGYITQAEELNSSLIWNDELRQYQESQTANWRRPDGTSTNISEISDFPVTHVSWFDAKAYCEWRGMRLPTIEEWEKAARGDSGNPYPWGNQWDETISNYYILNKSAIEPVGSRPQNISPYGVYDTVGNVMEWTNTTTSSNVDNPEMVERRGGSYLSEKVFHHVAWRNFSPPTSTNQALGFRCVLEQ